MSAKKQNLTIEQGVSWSQGWLVTSNNAPIDATWVSRSQIRSETTNALLHEFATEVTSEGAVVISVSPQESSPWLWNVGCYDVEVINADASLCLRVAEGHIFVSKAVTKN